jgi:hypothetical protein
MSRSRAIRRRIRPLIEDVAPLEYVEVPPSEERPSRKLRTRDRDRVMVDVIHDGNYIPPEFLVDRDGNDIPRRAWWDTYVAERDWGAEMVASALVARLGLGGYHRVNIARGLLDFGRFPGSTALGADHMQRYAIDRPFSLLLGPRQKRDLLELYYDRISNAIEDAVSSKHIKIAIHTYDDRDRDTGATRPQMSVITRSHGMDRRYGGPVAAFDELYPEKLGEFTADPVLRDRISLTLQKTGIFVEPNYPYSLPEGSLEVRSQVWSFFDFLRRLFEQDQPETAGEPEYQRVWAMLQDTNLRSVECGALRGYIHQYRYPPDRDEILYHRAVKAYASIVRFLRQDQQDIISLYRRSPTRLSSLAIEVRKDLLWELDDRSEPIRPLPERAAEIADVLARSIGTYLERDRGEAW